MPLSRTKLRDISAAHCKKYKKWINFAPHTHTFVPMCIVCKGLYIIMVVYNICTYSMNYKCYITPFKYISNK